MNDNLCIGHHNGRRPTAARYLCNHCIYNLEKDLAEIPALTDLIDREFLPGSSSPVDDGSRKTKGTPPLPLNLASLDALMTLQAILTSWCVMISEDRTITPPRSTNVVALSRYLLLHLDWIIEQPWVDDLQGELAASVRPLRVITGEVVTTVPIGASCTYCGEPSLRIRRDWTGDITCRTDGCLDEHGDKPRWTETSRHLLFKPTAEDVA